MFNNSFSFDRMQQNLKLSAFLIMPPCAYQILSLSKNIHPTPTHMYCTQHMRVLSTGRAGLDRTGLDSTKGQSPLNLLGCSNDSLSCRDYGSF